MQTSPDAETTVFPSNKHSSVSTPSGRNGGMVSELNSPSHVQPLGCFFEGISLTEPTQKPQDQSNQTSVQPRRYAYLVPTLVPGSNPSAVITSCQIQIIRAQLCLLAHMPLNLYCARTPHLAGALFVQPCKVLWRYHGSVSGGSTGCCRVAKFGSSLRILQQCINLLGQIVGCLLAGASEREVSFCR